MTESWSWMYFSTLEIVHNFSAIVDEHKHFEIVISPTTGFIWLLYYL